MSGVTPQDLSKHASADSCWITVLGKVYDVTDFLDEHPGGAAVLLKYAGKDATEEYSLIHAPDIVTEHLDPSLHLGPLLVKESLSSNAPPSAPPSSSAVAPLSTPELQRQLALSLRPPLSEVLSLHDFESIARQVMSSRGWAYYSSGADDETTMRENRSVYGRVWMRPRVMRDVTNVNFETSILGVKSSMPVYITATALGKLGHADGELNLTRAGGKHGVIQMIPTLASCSFDELVDAAIDGQSQFLQLYVNKDREKTKKIIQHAEKRGIKGLFITVDAPQLGRREKDMRQKFDSDADGANVQAGDKVQKDQGAARAISSFIDAGLCWKDLDWFKSITKMPIVLKGVQCWEDAVLAAEAGLAGVVLSNHGGRQLDFSRSGLEVLIEVKRELVARSLWSPSTFEIYVDGGVRRATDVLKAVALGAKAVGIGRPLIYAYSAFGQEGVEHAFQILKDEFEMNMRLLGARTMEEVTEDMVDAQAVGWHDGGGVPQDHMFTSNYERLSPVNLKAKL